MNPLLNSQPEAEVPIITLIDGNWPRWPKLSGFDLAGFGKINTGIIDFYQLNRLRRRSSGLKRTKQSKG